MDKTTLPKMSQEKEDFLRLFHKSFPTEEPEIQSCDFGETIDVMINDRFFFSITKEENFSLTYYGEFHYFTKGSELINYLCQKIGYDLF